MPVVPARMGHIFLPPVPLCSLPGISVSVFERTEQEGGQGSSLETHVGRLRCVTDPGQRGDGTSKAGTPGTFPLLSGAGPTSAHRPLSQRAPKGGRGGSSALEGQQEQTLLQDV